MDLEYRFYGLVAYQLGKTIHAGIQYGHAKDEYLISMLEILLNEKKYDSKSLDQLNAFLKWLKEDKTYIILSGGTTNNNPDKLGSLNKHVLRLKELDVFTATFCEPDLGDQLTAVVFLVDERVYDTLKYPYSEFNPKDIRSESFNVKNIKLYSDLCGVSFDEAIKLLELRKFIYNFDLA